MRLLFNHTGAVLRMSWEFKNSVLISNTDPTIDAPIPDRKPMPSPTVSLRYLSHCCPVSFCAPASHRNTKPAAPSPVAALLRHHATHSVIPAQAQYCPGKIRLVAVDVQHDRREPVHFLVVRHGK